MNVPWSGGADGSAQATLRTEIEKAGFRPEGVLRESLRYGDQWIDATVMSILAPEWPPAPQPRDDGPG